MCKSLVSLPERIGDLTALTELNLEYCYKLTSLPARFVELTSLRSLYFKETPAGESLKDSPAGAQLLQQGCYIRWRTW